MIGHGVDDWLSVAADAGVDAVGLDLGVGDASVGVGVVADLPGVGDITSGVVD